MKNFILTLFVLLVIPSFLIAQKNEHIAKGLRALEEVPRMVMPALNNEALLAEEMDRRGPGIAPKFAEHIEVNINTNTHGIWETATNGNEVWRLRIHSKDAKSLNLGFSKYRMPANGSLVLYTPKRSEVLGPFTPADNEEHEQLWTPVVAGDELIIEVQVPPSEKSALELELKSINHDYVGFTEMSMLSGSCNLDVICGEADGWGIVDGYRDIIRSVAVISQGGGTFCTGFLINNANNDCAPFFMTANHCGVNNANEAASLVAYWNFESPVCREPGSAASGGNGNGVLNDFNTGAIHRASWGASDFSLVEFDDPVSETANAFFAGWSAEYVMPQDTIICVHHPSTDEKRISFEFDPAQPGNGLNSNITTIDNATHVIIPDWDIGTTEGGSSGSPLFNNQKQVVGQLHGGGAACGNDLYDTYGWFRASWEGGGTPGTALKFWLDPNETGILNIPGRDCSYGIAADNSFQELCATEEAVYTVTTTENFEGPVTLSIDGLPTGATATFGQNPIDPNNSTTITVVTTAGSAGQYEMTVTASDGINDGTSTLVLSVFGSEPEMLSLNIPNNTATEVLTAPSFEWGLSDVGAVYTFELASDETFTNIIELATDLPIPNYNASFLEVLTTYYWRVKGTNICGEGPWSDTWSFTTADISCGVLVAGDTPLEIGDGGGGVTVTSTITINAAQSITGIKVVDLDIAHSYAGDLSATLTSPSAIVVQLFDRPGVPDSQFGCDGADIFVSFDDAATNTADDFENACDDTPAVGGVFQPIDALEAFIGTSASGEWILTVVDNAGGDGGAINNWKLEICTGDVLDLSMVASESSIENCTGEEAIFSVTLGDGFEAGGVNLAVTGNPPGSTVSLSNNPAMPGETVTVTISNITTTGFYTVLVDGDDGANNNATSVGLTTSAAPSASMLTTPADMSDNIPLSPVLQWGVVADAESYEVEVATDDSFATVLYSNNTTTTNFPIIVPFNEGTTYYWRVTAENDCGESISTTSSFTTEVIIAVDELEGNTFEIMPNPTNGMINIVFAQAMDRDLRVAVYSIDGKLLQQTAHTSGMTSIPVSLDYTNGVYIIRLVTEKSAVARRVLLQK